MNRFERVRTTVELSAVRIAAVIAIGASALVGCSEPTTVEAATPPSTSQPATETSPGALAAEPLEVTGYDVSFPQCDTTLPAPGAFAIVGLNEYLPTIPNPCFDELADWASQSTGGTSQPKLAVYVSAANPGNLTVPTWPKDGQNKYGACVGQDTAACAYEYGQDRIQSDMQTLSPRKPDSVKWWIDVEPEYSWEGQATGQARNAAVLEGMVDALTNQGAQVGIYSSPAIWQQIVGTTSADSSLQGLDNWLLGAHSQQEAEANCQTPSFTGGRVVMAQYVTDSLDKNVAC